MKTDLLPINSQLEGNFLVSGFSLVTLAPGFNSYTRKKFSI